MKGTEDTIKDYQQRINKALIYVEEHMGEKIEIEKLAQISNFSVYHFHRIVSAYLNEPLGTFLHRLRLDKAARLLEYSDESIKNIAYEVGFEVPSSLNKAFKKRFGITPAEFRNGQKARVTFDIANFKSNVMDLNLKPEIKKIEEKKVVYVQAMGAYNESAAKAWEDLCKFMKEKDLFTFGIESIGISHDDPHVTEADKLRYDACFTTKKDIQPEGKVGVKTIAGGKYAVFKYKGPYTNLTHVYDYIFKTWLPASGRELEDKMCFEKYINSPEKHKQEDYRTHIYIPIVD